MILAAKLKERLSSNSTTSSPEEKNRSLGGDENSSGFELTKELEEIQRQFSRALSQDSMKEIRRVLRARQSILRCIWLGSARPVEKEQAMRDLVREPCISLNGVHFCGEDENLFKMSLTRLIPYCFSAGHLKEFSHVIDILISRMARTSAGADSYFVLQWLFGLDLSKNDSNYYKNKNPHDYVIMPAKKIKGDSTNEIPSLEIVLRCGSIQDTMRARLACRNAYTVQNIERSDDSIVLFTTVIEELVLDQFGKILQDDRYLAIALKDDLRSSIITLLPSQLAVSDDFSSYYDDAGGDINSPFSSLTSTVQFSPAAQTCSLNSSLHHHHHQSKKTETTTRRKNGHSSKYSNATSVMTGGRFIIPSATPAIRAVSAPPP
mmetsp:Transcript_3608/g.5058  ORF Transcript_3608/g.5058 Transcript_3608/m.5058 type:complete len:377 (+) Transcript_3608:75-1205(+)|eukprot:CAMPEP_0197295328 /NCGR_PEP_ID=MMETSP0890-20130614/35225_1 /TAXON_ID=44058 ORGANISM="Aureoumbra lagunensis, Strain CCMP1510" /NCGR_SAMPLE_ID=MMETSP0890 /ASSEMBLY_ACC=CAM_ASM_000533 /LENGTH=376 /DNA_ID=CAMNT_0042771243 /DNA_START=42 /DNA_END=1172 /DNA_ORIENTATION=-